MSQQMPWIMRDIMNINLDGNSRIREYWSGLKADYPRVYLPLVFYPLRAVFMW